MVAEYDDEAVSADAIVSAVADAGYGLSSADDGRLSGMSVSVPLNRPVKSAESPDGNTLMRLIVSIVFFRSPFVYRDGPNVRVAPGPCFYGRRSINLSLPFYSFLLALPVAYVNRSFFIRGFKSLARLAPNMDSLIAIGSTAAMGYGVYTVFFIAWKFGLGSMGYHAPGAMNLYFDSGRDDPDPCHAW